MYRAVALIELLITLVIIIISIYFISPILFRIQIPILLNNEIDQIKTFIYKIQTQARYKKQRYSLTISQNKTTYDWCIIAIEKHSSKEIICDCLNITNCKLDSSYYIYKSKLKNLELKSKNIYPNSFMNIYGNAGRLETVCLGLKYNQYQKVIQFDANGIINVAQDNKRTKCRE